MSSKMNFSHTQPLCYWVVLLFVIFGCKTGDVNKNEELSPDLMRALNRLERKEGYSLTSAFKNGSAWVETEDGIKNRVNEKGHLIYDKVRYNYKIQSYKQLTRYYVRKNGKTGIIDDEGAELIPPVYDYLDYNSQYVNLLQARKGSKAGYINFRNEVIMPFSFDNIKIINYGKNGNSEIIAQFCKNGKYGFIDFDEKVLVPAEYDEAGFYRDGRGTVKRLGKWGVVNSDNATVLPLQYDKIWAEDDLQRFYSSYYYVAENGKLGIVNFNNGKVIVPAEYDAFTFNRRNSNLIGVKKDGKKGYLDFNGNTVFSPIYEDIAVNQNGSIAKFAKDGKWGFVKIDDKIIVPAEYEEAAEFFLGLAPVKKGEKWGFIDETGKVVVPFTYDTMRQFYGPNQHGEVAMVEGGGKTFWIAPNGKATEYVSN